MTTPSRDARLDEITALFAIKNQQEPGSPKAVAIKAQISVLTENLGEDEIHAYGWTEEQEVAALDALKWLTGESQDRASEGWKTVTK